MKQLKKYWYIISLLVVTLGLGVVTFLTSQKLTETKSVAPNVPQEKPKALSAACTLQFSIITPTATPTATLTTTVTITPTLTLTPTMTNTPTPTTEVTNTPTPTPRQVVGCNLTCSNDTDCQDGLICSSSGTCRNASCTDRTNCTCVTATSTVTPTTQPNVIATPTEVPLPQTPVSGSPAILGFTVAAAGIMLLLLGLVF